MFAGLGDFAGKVGDRLSKRPKTKTYSSRNYLHRRMLSLHPAFPGFVSGPKCGSGKFFFCRVCHRDVGMHEGTRFRGICAPFPVRWVMVQGCYLSSTHELASVESVYGAYGVNPQSAGRLSLEAIRGSG